MTSDARLSLFSDVPADCRPSRPTGLLPLTVEAARYGRGLVGKMSLLPRCLATGRELVFVFSHPRTGSTAIWASLVGSAAFAAIHAHGLSRAHVRWRSEHWPVAADGVLTFGSGNALVLRASVAIGHTRFVVPIRDPVAVNISMFLYWGPRFWVPAEWNRLEALSDTEIARLFLARYPHHSAVRWMSREFTPATGLRFDGVRFDTTRAAAVVCGDRTSALMLRSDLEDQRKHAEICDFLGGDVPPLARLNSTGGRLAGRPALHDRVRRVVAGIPGYVDMLLEDPFVRFFWSQDDRAAMRRHWAQVAGDHRGRTGAAGAP